MHRLVILLFTLSYTVGFAQPGIETRKFSPAEMQSDVAFMFQSFEHIHPSLYHYTDKNSVQAAREALLSQLQDSLTRLEFSQKVIPVVSFLRDGHTSLTFPQEERTTYLKQGGKVFPLDVLIRNNKIFIAENYSADSSLTRFSEIHSVNGITSQELLNKLRPYISAELDFYRDVRVQFAFRRLLWYVTGFTGDYELELLSNNEIIRHSVAGITETEFTDAVKKKGLQVNRKPYAFYQVENRIGVIDFRSMSNYDAFQKFLDSTFAVAKKENLQHLVIDIRNNGGGNSMLGDALFDYITEKPYKQVERMEIKTSSEAAKNMRKKHFKWYMYPAYPFLIFSKQARAYLFKKNGSMTVFEVKEARTPEKVENKFSGKTYLLTSNLTFSSANMLASAYKFYNMGTVIGEETGGVLTAFGDLIEITLPNTKLKAYCSHKKFVHPGADGQLHGVKPDIEIIPSQADIQSGRDAAMEYVKMSVKSGQ